LAKLGRQIERRRELAARYQRLLAGIPGLVTIRDPAYGTTNYQSFWVMLPDGFPVSRDDLLRMLADAGVSARRGIMAAHLEPAYAEVPCPPLPVTERITAGSLILPLFHELTEEEQDLVVSVVHAAARLRQAAGRAGPARPRGGHDGRAREVAPIGDGPGSPGCSRRLAS